MFQILARECKIILLKLKLNKAKTLDQDLETKKTGHKGKHSQRCECFPLFLM